MARVVYEIENSTPSTFETSCRTNVVLPDPDGADMTNRFPRLVFTGLIGSLDVLHLFSHALQLGFDGNHPFGDGRVLALGADRIRFTIHFLNDEI